MDFYGAAARITAAAEQGSVELGGSVFVVVTVTDAAGNGVPGRDAAAGPRRRRRPGARPGAVTVRAAANVAKDVSGTAGDIPACSAGTDAAGRCVMLVTAPNPAGAANDAARGTHTLTVVGASPIPAAAHKVTVDIDVAGPAERVSTDAPGRVEPGSSTDITATVTDDRGVRAGAQSVTVTRIAGGGRLVNAGPATTRDGQHTFTYRADARAGAAEFLVEVRALDGDGNAAGRVLARTRLAIRVGAGAAAALPTLTPAPRAGLHDHVLQRRPSLRPGGGAAGVVLRRPGRGLGVPGRRLRLRVVRAERARRGGERALPRAVPGRPPREHGPHHRALRPLGRTPGRASRPARRLQAAGARLRPASAFRRRPAHALAARLRTRARW